MARCLFLWSPFYWLARRSWLSSENTIICCNWCDWVNLSQNQGRWRRLRQTSAAYQGGLIDLKSSSPQSIVYYSKHVWQHYLKHTQSSGNMSSKKWIRSWSWWWPMEECPCTLTTWWEVVSKSIIFSLSIFSRWTCWCCWRRYSHNGWGRRIGEA